MTNERCKHGVYKSHRCPDCENEVTTEDALRFIIDEKEKQISALYRKVEELTEQLNKAKKYGEDLYAELNTPYE